jgi:hypothetical protein
MQSKQKSFIESVTNTVFGLVTSFIIQLVIYPVLSIPVTLKQNAIITVVFFVASIGRGYLIRRFFNRFDS